MQVHHGIFMKSRTSLILQLLKNRVDPNAMLLRLVLLDALAGCESVLDVGCGISGILREIGVAKTTGFDGYQPDLDKAKRQNTHDEFVLGDARKLTDYFQPKHFDACIALDVIEHLTKEDGLKLMQNMEKLARKTVVFFTPNGFLPQRHSAEDDLQVHLSGWKSEEMNNYGYEVTGLLGPKSLRGEGHMLKKRPAVVWAAVSFLGQICWTKRHPAKAAAIFCAKTFPRR
jgi:2-polyprenyl-3-methyl-5-hydroxy-6-metoxy-1,4-benzoquinol methylase